MQLLRKIWKREPKLIRFTKKKYGDELPTVLNHFRNWFPENPLKRERLALLAIYVQHHKEEIENSPYPEGELRELYEEFGFNWQDIDGISFAFSALNWIIKASERVVKGK